MDLAYLTHKRKDFSNKDFSNTPFNPVLLETYYVYINRCIHTYVWRQKNVNTYMRQILCHFSGVSVSDLVKENAKGHRSRKFSGLRQQASPRRVAWGWVHLVEKTPSNGQ